MNGKENNQSRGYSHTIDPGELHEYLAGIQEEWKHIPCGPKGEVERFLERGAGFFPSNLYIQRAILQTEDSKTIRHELLKGIEQGFSLGVRSVANRRLFGGEKLPWNMEITSKDKVDNFINHTLPTWQEEAVFHNYSISQLILMFNPPEIGTRIPLHNQFVARVEKDMFHTTDSGRKSRILMELATGTNQLRGLDKQYNLSNAEAIRLRYEYTPTGVFINRMLQAGFLHPNNLLFHDITGKPLSRIHIDNISPEKKDITRSALLVLNEIITNPDFQKRLEFFADIGLNTIEFQGHVNLNTKKAAAFIYGLRGPKDEAILEGIRPYNFESRSTSD